MKFFYKKGIGMFLVTVWLVSAAAGCTSTRKMINQGQYDRAINKSVKKLQRNKNKEKQIRYLQGAFFKANQRDLDEIKYLKKEDRPENAVKIYQLYEQIRVRQQKIKPLLPLYINRREVKFEMVDVDSDMLAFKKEAAGYLYQNAIKLLATGNKYKARQAYGELVQLKELYSNYKDVEDKINEAFNAGQNYVIYAVNNQTPSIIPREFVDELYSLDMQRLNGQWYSIETYNKRNKDQTFDFKILVRLKFVEIGPEMVKEVHYDETKEVRDGWKYEYDDRGNVKKDSSGNDIKVPRYKEITAHITETRQLKEASFDAEIEIIDLSRNTQIKRYPLRSKFVFEHFSAVVHGNQDALSKETKVKLNSKPLPFPSDFQMIMDGSQDMKLKISDFISRNKALLEQ